MRTTTLNAAVWALLVTGCIAGKPPVSIDPHMPSCILSETKWPVQIRVPEFSQEIIRFEESTAIQEILVVKVTPGRNESICRRMTKDRVGNWTMIALVKTANLKRTSVKIGSDKKLSALVQMVAARHYLVINESGSGHTPYVTVSIRNAGNTICSLSSEGVDCLPGEELRKVAAINDVAKYVLDI